MSTNLKDSVFQRATGLLGASGTPIIKHALRSIGAVSTQAARTVRRIVRRVEKQVIDTCLSRAAMELGLETRA